MAGKFSLPGLALPGITRDEAKPSRLAKWGPTIAMIVLVALAAWLATRWFWHLYPQPAASAPAPRAAPSQTIAQSAEMVAAAQIFGSATVAPAASQISTLNVKLKGVFAGRTQAPAAAILNTGQKDEFVRTGGEVVPGVVLESVYPTHVLLKRAGRLERVNLEERVAGDGGGARNMQSRRPGIPQFAPPAMAPQSPAIAPPPPPTVAPVQPPMMGGPGMPGFPNPNSPNLPPGVPIPGVPPPGPPANMPLQQSGQNGADFGRVVMGASGVTVESVPSGSVLSRIGLQAGDVIKSVNGQPVNGAGDLARAYGQAANGQTLQGEIQRGGRTLPISVTVRR